MVVSIGALTIGAVVALGFAYVAWRILGAVVGAETLVVGVVVAVAVAAVYGLFPPLFGFVTTSSGVVVAGLISAVLLRLLSTS